MNSIHRLILIVFVLIISLSAAAPVSGYDDPNSIEPGWRAGLVIMSMVPDDIERVYGQPEVFVIPGPVAGEKKTMLQYKQLGLDFIFKRNQMEEIYIHYPNFSYKNIKVGTHAAAVEETLGKRYVRENYKHSYESDIPDYKMIYEGITFNIKKDRIVYITVTRVE